jgi:diguanylate cyclase (GGDEF)-like protein
MKSATAVLPHRVLVVDDNPNLQKIISTNLELAGYRVDTVSNGGAALATMEHTAPDLLLLDVMMPHVDGYEVARRVRTHANPSVANVPIIMLTAKSETEDKLRGFEAGADDYITKPFGSRELLARVRAKIRRVEADTALSPLTRLPGNLAIESDLRRRLAAGEPFAVLYLDWDHFKAFNDVYGFTRGDVAIRLVARAAVGAVRTGGTPEDFVGHIGGDDFIVVTQPQCAEALARDIITQFDREIPALYSASDVENGYLESSDRRGVVGRFPIMSLSIAIVSDESGRLDDYARIGEIAAELKGRAKSLSGSVFVRERRR